MERKCGKIHSSIEEAIVHAEQNLGFYRKPADRYFVWYPEEQLAFGSWAFKSAPESGGGLILIR
jgi:hypothetical protein